MFLHICGFERITTLFKLYCLRTRIFFAYNLTILIWFTEVLVGDRRLPTIISNNNFTFIFRVKI